MNGRVEQLLGIRYPIIQAGMVWVSGWKLCAAVSRAGVLGMLGAGSMKPELLQEHIAKTRTALNGTYPFGVNIPLMRKDAPDLIEICISEHVSVVFTSAGNPALYTDKFHAAGIKVIHVVPTAKLARKAEERGVDAVVCEGTEAGGHNGVDEIPTFVLIPQVRNVVSIPVIAAGGIVDGRGMAGAMALGADGVQIGTRFAATVESAASERYKQAILEAGEIDTVLSLKNTGPTRMIKNPFALKCMDYEKRGASVEETRDLLATKREMKGISEGDWEEGQFEAGMGVGLIHEILPAATVVENIMTEFYATLARLSELGEKNKP
jgi:enoyl-[acyl-carrier protein] reductase II